MPLPCGTLGWPSRQLLSARKYTVGLLYRIDSYHVVVRYYCHLLCVYLYAVELLTVYCTRSQGTIRYCMVIGRLH